jgi:hypothetical protein
MGDGSSGDSGVTGRERRDGRGKEEDTRMIFEAMDKQEK